MKFKRILIGIDDSKYADNATQCGFELARTFDAQVALVHITEPIVVSSATDSGLMGSLIPPLGVPDAEVLNIQDEYAGKLLASTIEKYAGDIPVTQFNEYGATADAIISCIAQFNADLVVLGTHSRTGLDRFFMGSIAEDVVRNSPVAVLVVPMKAEE